MKLKDIFIVTRSWSLSITFISVTIGTVLATQEGRISLFLYFITLLGATFFHAAANTLNDYFDLKNKIDTPDAPTTLYRPHPVFTNLLSSKKLFILSLSLLSGSLVIGILLAVLRTSWIWLFMLLGLFLAVFYTGGPRGLKYLALGELTVFLAFGPLMIEGAYAVQRATVSWRTFYVSLPIGLLVSLILLANNLRDIEFDARSGIKTLCTILGHNKALRLYRILSVLPFVLVFIYILFRILSWPALLVFLSFPSTIRVNKDFMDEIPASSDARTSQLSLLFGLLLIAALILE